MPENKVVHKKNKAFYNRLKRIGKQSVEIGYFSDSEPQKNPKKKAKRIYTLTELAVIHELGNAKGNIPSRPFMQITFNDNKKDIKERASALYADAIYGKIRVPTAGKRVGLAVERAIKKTFKEGATKFTPLSVNYKKRPSGTPVTDSSVPLTDEGTLKNAVSSRVKEGV